MSLSVHEQVRSVDPVREFAQASLGDPRRTARCMHIARALQRSPGASLPRAMATETELVGAYRFFNSRHVSTQLLLEPHLRATAERAQAAGDWLAIHDTSEIEFDGDREGLGYLRLNGRGFLAHATLAATADGIPLPLGVMALEMLTRPKRRRSSRRSRKPKYSLSRRNEHSRWHRGVCAVEERVQGGHRPIHVMDREGDSYLLLSKLIETGCRFIIRLTHDRALVTAGEPGPRYVSEAVAKLPVQAKRLVRLSSRSPKGKAPKALKRFPPRVERDAELVVSSSSIAIKRPHAAPASLPESLTLRVVRVREPQPPEGLEPVEWLLLTSEPVATAEQVLKVVDCYRRRWLIEELFKALKTGCAVEQRQFETADALKKIFALSVPIACQMLALRTLARQDENAPATIVLSSRQIEVLHAASDKLPPRQRPPENPTAAQALRAIAAHGGHLTANGDPGWLTIARGFDRLRELELGYTLALRRFRRSVR